ncbi:MAG: aminoacyl-tRNA hydrolase [Candidatus Saccharibacteria bacterium]|nr:MAG: aminoacyl-tRNA hydrolase [Candidatus Saccharibacteria bacterium]
MKIVFAQGNPGAEYSRTRHNVGFLMVDTYAHAHNADFTRKAKFQADIAEISVKGEKVLLVKPTTFYNETGQSARALLDFYKLDPSKDFLVIHDDLALPFGTIRTRDKGRDAGNNGIKSLNAHIGEHHNRIRVGIYNELRDRMPDADFVLARFSENENNALTDVYKHVLPFIDGFIADSFHLTKVTLEKN